MKVNPEADLHDDNLPQRHSCTRIEVELPLIHPADDNGADENLENNSPNASQPPDIQGYQLTRDMQKRTIKPP